MALADYFLKIEGIEGESQDHKHKSEIQVESWSWGATQAQTTGVGGGHGAGKVAMQDLHFTMPLSKASPKLMLACATGQHIPNAVLTCRKAGGEQEEFLTITLNDVYVSSYQVGGHGGNISAADQGSLAFAKVQFKYQQQSEKGNVGSPVLAGWDVKANKKF